MENVNENYKLGKVHVQMAAVGFEPTPPKRLLPKTSALDRSATLPGDVVEQWLHLQSYRAFQLQDAFCSLKMC